MRETQQPARFTTGAADATTADAKGGWIVGRGPVQGSRSGMARPVRQTALSYQRWLVASYLGRATAAANMTLSMWLLCFTRRSGNSSLGA
jgi:hypothetical protein